MHYQRPCSSVAVVVLLTTLRTSSGMVVKGALDVLESWRFVTRFAFLPVPEQAEMQDGGYPQLDFTVRFAPHSKVGRAGV